MKPHLKMERTATGWQPILFIAEAKKGYVLCFTATDGHSDADIGYMETECRPPETDAEFAACAALMERYKASP